jgi:hypothetical protein
MSRILFGIVALGLTISASAQTAPQCSAPIPDGRMLALRIDAPLPGTLIQRASPCPEFVSVQGVASTVGIEPRLDVFFALDRSGSTGDCSGADIDGDTIVGQPRFGGCTDRGDTILAAELQAVRNALDELEPADARVAIITFNGGAELRMALSATLNRARAELDEVFRDGPAGRTNFVVALEEMRFEFLRSGSPSTRVPIGMFLSDGEDTVNSFLAIRQEALELAGLGVRVNTFGVGLDADRFALETIAAVTGGRYFDLPDPATIVTVLPEVVLVGIELVEVLNLTTGDLVAGPPSPGGNFDASLPVAQGLNEIRVVAVADDPDATSVECFTDVTIQCAAGGCQARTQGYWQRQCQGPHPDWDPATIEAVFEAVSRELEPLGVTACDALELEDTSDPCGRATKQTAALWANILSGVLGPDCDVDLSDIDPDAPAQAGALGAYLVQLILDGECKLANDLADAVNTSAAIVGSSTPPPPPPSRPSLPGPLAPASSGGQI